MDLAGSSRKVVLSLLSQPAALDLSHTAAAAEQQNQYQHTID